MISVAEAGEGVLGINSESANREVWSALSSSVSMLLFPGLVDVDVDDTLGVERSCVDCGGGGGESMLEGWECEGADEDESPTWRSRWSRRSGNACEETRLV